MFVVVGVHSFSQGKSLVALCVTCSVVTWDVVLSIKAIALDVRGSHYSGLT